MSARPLATLLALALAPPLILCAGRLVPILLHVAALS
jgi:hypothetical protein